MCHYRHYAHPDPFFWPGLQDITTHVDFSHLAATANTCGFHVAGYTAQAYFLLALGLLEFVRICEDHSFYDLVISMKASNPQVMVQAYRMLMQQMLEKGMVYPLHLGVPEAGEGEDGRMKSAIGIGTLAAIGLAVEYRVHRQRQRENVPTVSNV